MLTLMLATALASDDVAISVHLHEVVHTLRAETPADLAPDVRQRRLDLLDALEGYAVAGDFPEHPPGPAPARKTVPSRAFEPGDRVRAPVFVDEEGTHCAVGYLMALDAPAMVDTIRRTANEAWVPDLRVDGVGDWAADHGFTVDELAWIQPSYDLWAGACADEGPHYAPVDIDPPEGVLGSAQICPDVLVLAAWPPGGHTWCAETCDDLVAWVQLYNPNPFPIGFEAADAGDASGIPVALAPKDSMIVGPFASPNLELRATSCEGETASLSAYADYGNGGRLCIVGCDAPESCDRPPFGGNVEPVEAGVDAGCGCAQGGSAGWAWVLAGLPWWWRRTRHRTAA